MKNKAINNPFEQAVNQFKQVAKLLKLEDEFVGKLSEPDRVVYKQLSVVMDDKKIQKFDAWRSQHNNALGPYKGGIRFHPNVYLDEVKALSMWMSWKTALLNLPFGGGKGGIAVDPKKLSLNEKERLCREYMKEFVDILGPWNDVPAPDVGCGANEMAWLADEFRNQMLSRSLTLTMNPIAVVTGKPLLLGGSLGREEATGRGGLEVLDRLVELEVFNGERTIVVQGFGNVGYWFAKLAIEKGWRIIAVSDSSGGTYDYQGLNIDMVFDHKMKGEKIDSYPYGKALTNNELLKLDCGVLVPAALEGIVDTVICDDIKAELILELANGPVTFDAEKILLKKKIKVIPDILANAGGVTVSWMEWVQNLNGDKWTINDVNLKLSNMMRAAVDEVFAVMESEKVSWRTAGYMVSVKRVYEAIKHRGV